MKRDDFFKAVTTAERTTKINVSQGELLDAGNRGHDYCLIQVGQEGNYACAYLTEHQVRDLRETLTKYLKAK